MYKLLVVRCNSGEGCATHLPRVGGGVAVCPKDGVVYRRDVREEREPNVAGYGGQVDVGADAPVEVQRLPRSGLNAKPCVQLIAVQGPQTIYRGV